MQLSQVIGELRGRAGGPLYQQLHRALREAIEDKRLASDSPLPPERDIASELGVSRITVRKALDALVERGAADAAPRRRHVCGASRGSARREELLQALLLLRGHDLARAQRREATG